MYLPSFSLKGKLAFVTGATKGIGRAISLAFAESGADLILVSRTESELDNVKEEAKRYGGNVYTVCGDVNNYESIMAKMDDMIGMRPLDIFVNNVGMNIRSKAVDVTESEWNQIVDTNMKSAFFLAQGAAKRMQHNKNAKIINISSVGGHVALRTGVVYAMTKSAIIQMTKNLALEWGEYGIRVNAIGPWYFPTALTERLLENEEYKKEVVSRTPLGRVGKLEELAGTAVFLASDASNYITGQTLFVDGGMTIYGF
ncbi:glucose 1-dehydrogenase [Aquibacillus sp. 3ASR75-11]|uniref:L-rhamnose 1-dehydrogenase (NAD(P)(+)) n=1 Tax=Terrihalobacillus insolitus TaxID=2950438 RepID=A0A9X3WS51_9BACI|nr:glucose 1-dehydrogenase [Terrihalobacillus insolitus]MDC3413003.1 glucose 1-dehydrogenase [Terrihalobacillus insolitus]MDC3424745.1 glucose 1-dehydrogenase [Terrihalobacillus insolitus]